MLNFCFCWKDIEESFLFHIQPRVSINQFVGKTPLDNKKWILQTCEKNILEEHNPRLFNVEELYEFRFSLEKRKSKAALRRNFGEEIDRIGSQIRPVQIYLLYATALANARDKFKDFVPLRSRAEIQHLLDVSDACADRLTPIPYVVDELEFIFLM